MLFFLSRNGKLLSLFFLGLFFLSSNHYGNHLIVEAVKVAVGVTIDDYKCKDHGCGCTTAFKCLTDCCCTFSEPEDFAAICNSIAPVQEEAESCCSTEVPEYEPEQENPSRGIILPSRCSADKYFSYQVSQGFLLKLTHDVVLPKEDFTEFQWLSNEEFTAQSVTEDLLKVPIQV